MANPNIVAVTTIYGTTTYYTPTGTTAVVLLANTASSGKVYKINQIVCSNVNGSTASAVRFGSPALPNRRYVGPG